MVQEFYVLKCCSCEFFQVHIVKKAKKWSCKVCGQKQSVVKIFGQGSAKDCRIHVQILNEQRVQNSQNLIEKYDQIDSSDESETLAENYDESLKDGKENDDLELQPDCTTSKWQKYLEPDDDADQLLNDTKSQKYSYSSDLVQHDKLDEPVSKKLRLSRDDSAMEKQKDVDEIHSSSKEVSHFLAKDEVDAIVESDDVDEQDCIDKAYATNESETTNESDAVYAMDAFDKIYDSDEFDPVAAYDAIDTLNDAINALDELDDILDM